MAKVLDQVKVKQGRLIRVENTERTFGSSDVYVAVQVENADGSDERCLLFTEKEIQAAQERADKNKEDLTNRSFITDLLD
jgi:hypothetical protein